MASYKKNNLKSGISYRIQVKVKSPRTNTQETKTMTWKVPKGLTEEEIQTQLKEICNKFENEVKHKELGLKINDNSMKLFPFIDRWLDRIETNKSKNYYIKGVQTSKIIKDYFGDIKLSEITPINVQGFMDTLFKHKVTRHSSQLIGDLKTVLLSRLLTLEKVKELTGIKRGTVERALAVYPIQYANALALCNGLKLPYNKYFKDIIVEQDYAKESIKKHRNILSAILASAKKLGYIEDNYASPEYLEPIRGYKKEIPILDKQEARQLLEALDKIEEPRRKIALIIVLLMGIRRAELAGLEWKDIDFENKTMTIERTSFRDKGGVTYTKSPKTERSKRVISMPETLIKYLLDYKVWWEQRRSILKSVWKNNDRILLSDDGRIVCPTMYNKWLHKILEDANLPVITLHALRHTNITLQITSDVDSKTVSVRAGHARTSTTIDFYSHFVKLSDKNASTKLNDLFNKKEKLKDGNNS